MPLKIAIPGGSGHIGTILARHFFEQGHDVTVITRHPKSAEWRVVEWDGNAVGSWADCLEGADLVINLAGSSVNCRYTQANRREIRNSRIFTTRLVGEAIERCSRPPRVWMNASTATIYRHSIDSPMDEISGELGGSEPGMPETWRFSIEVAAGWERTLFAVPVSRTRRIALRTGMLMSPERGGAFDKLLELVRWGLGGTAGTGDQYVSWIHDIDFVRAIEFLIEHEELDGPVNISSPCPVPNREFMCALRRTWCTSYIGIPAPSWALSIGAVLLRTEPELVLKSRRVVPKRLRDAGFEFHFPNWRSACQDLVHRWRELHGD
jgi:uncharacterized protein (TIGR01777 family)